MGLFNARPAKNIGVGKDERKKRGFFLYIDVLWNKMFKMVGANCLYTLTSLLWLVGLYYFFGIMLINTGLMDYIAGMIMNAVPDANRAEMVANVSVMIQIFLSVAVFVLWGSGPSSAAYAYINRCFTRSEPVWVVSDGWDKFKENFKQAIVVVVIDALFLFFAFFSVSFYHSMYTETHSLIWMITEYLIIVAAAIYTMMHSYLYHLMVTFECSISSLYKNALYMTLAKLPGTLVVNAISAGILVGIFMLIDLNPLFAAILVGVFGLCVTRYVTDFYAARVIDRNILKNMKEKNAKAPVIEYEDEEETAE